MLQCACELALGNSCPSSLTCFTPSRLLLFNAKLCPVLQIRPELIGRDAELPTATGVIAAALMWCCLSCSFESPLACGCVWNLQSDLLAMLWASRVSLGSNSSNDVCGRWKAGEG